jgi:hypothetical protein
VTPANVELETHEFGERVVIVFVVRALDAASRPA